MSRANIPDQVSCNGCDWSRVVTKQETPPRKCPDCGDTSFNVEEATFSEKR